MGELVLIVDAARLVGAQLAGSVKSTRRLAAHTAVPDSDCRALCGHGFTYIHPSVLLGSGSPKGRADGAKDDHVRLTQF